MADDAPKQRSREDLERQLENARETANDLLDALDIYLDAVLAVQVGDFDQDRARTAALLMKHRLRAHFGALHGKETVALGGHQMLENVHSRDECAGDHCSIHNPSDHHMRDWPMNWRSDRDLMERICPHGIGHPDPDHMAHIERVKGKEFADAEGVHGCDGCCLPQEASS